MEEAIVITFSRSTELGPVDGIPRVSVRSSVSKITTYRQHAPYNTDSPHGDASVRAMSRASMMMSAAEAMAKACRMVNPPQMVLYVITVSILKYDLIESSAAKPDLIVSEPPEKIEQGPLQKPDLVESAPTKKLDLIESSTQPGPAEELHLVESRPSRNSQLIEPGPARKLDFNQP